MQFAYKITGLGDGLGFWLLEVIGRDLRAARPYLFSDGQNIYNQVVLVSTVNVYISVSLGRRPILQVQ